MSLGSFDREHWAGKFRDFPLGMMQSALHQLVQAQTKRVVYEDARYIFRRGSRAWVTQRLEAGSGVAIDRTTWQIEATFQEIQQVQATTWSFLILRVLNLTLFRRLIVRRLITQKWPGPFRLIREMRIQPDRIDFTDRVERLSNIQLHTVRLPRSFNPIHMGFGQIFPSRRAGADSCRPPLGRGSRRSTRMPPPKSDSWASSAAPHRGRNGHDGVGTEPPTRRPAQIVRYPGRRWAWERTKVKQQ